MTPPPPARRQTHATPSAAGRAGGVAGALEAAMVAALAQERPEADPVLASLQLDLSGHAAAAADLALVVWVERATRTLAFVSGEASVGGSRIAAASAVFDLRAS